MRIEGKKIVITGAASGIGKALIEILRTLETVEIVAADRDDLDAVNSKALVHRYCGDIAQPAGIDELFEFALEKMGRIDLFFANAGFAYYEKAQREDWQHLQSIYACNTFSPIYTAHKMARLNKGREYGVVITASFMGIFNLSGYSLYGSTKAALLSWEDAYRLEKQDQGHIMMLCPVATRTQFFDSTSAPVPWPRQTPAEVAAAAIRGVERNQRRIFPSGHSRLTLLLDRFMPFVMRVYQLLESKKFHRWLESR